MRVLPKTNELGFFEIRLESIGGLGANLAGKMLAEAGVVGSGFNGVSFSSYGSEKKKDRQLKRIFVFAIWRRTFATPRRLNVRT